MADEQENAVLAQEGPAPAQEQPTPADTTPSPAVSRAFVALCLLLLIGPLALMPVLGEGTSAGEKRELAPMPQLTTEDGSVNTAYLGQLGAYFEDRFAFRSTLVDLDATLRERVLHTSATSNVIVGTDGWLYYQGTMPDYQRTAPLSDRTLRNIAHNLALTQEHVEHLGKHFCVTIAPNKATLYPGHLPYHVKAGEGASNLERLEPLLAEAGVHYVSLTDALRAEEGELYLARDSHWTNAGALVGYQTLTEALGREPMDFSGATQPIEHIGDLESMLHPSNARPEMDQQPEAAQQFAYVGDATDVEEPFIQTESTADEADGTLIAFRDSFGNTLLPYLASAYTQATFTKMVPYNMSAQALGNAEDVLVERVERHLSSFASDPAYLPAPTRGIVEVAGDQASDTTIYLATNGPYLVVEGDLDPTCAEAGSLYVTARLEDGRLLAFEPYWVSPAVVEGTADTAGAQDAGDQHVTTDYGYRSYLPLAAFGSQQEAQVRVVVSSGSEESFVNIADASLELGG